MIYTAASHQGAIQMFWLQYLERSCGPSFFTASDWFLLVGGAARRVVLEQPYNTRVRVVNTRLAFPPIMYRNPFVRLDHVT